MQEDMSFLMQRDPKLNHVVKLAREFYQQHRNPKRVFKLDRLALSELRTLAKKATVSLEVLKSVLYSIDVKVVAEPELFGEFQCSGHLKNDISPQAIVDLGSAEEAIIHGELPEKVKDTLDNVELAVYFVFCKLEDESGLQYDRIILDNEQDLNHVVVEIGRGHFKTRVEAMSEVFRVNLEQRLLSAMSSGRFWQQVYC